MPDIWGYSYDNPWFFTNYGFIMVLFIFLIGYCFFPKMSIWKKLYIILFSAYFYYKSSGPYFAIFITVILLDYNIAATIEKIKNIFYKKVLLTFSIVVSLSFLLYFKYSGFLLDLLNDLTGSAFSVSELFLPLGISFYTFQSISYIVDVYRGTIKSSDNFIDYVFYMTFFPHLVAGPIVRAKDFIYQINDPLQLDYGVVSNGLFRILTGLVKKLIVADFIAKYIDLIHSGPKLFSGFENLISMYGYTLQIYFDFSGYSDIAIGIALLLGYTLKENFDNPYRAKNITEFWRKWHISLSSWLRDYIYIPLGGNRKGEFNTYLFLMITMLIGGIWHGASWKFVVWGALHGLALAVHKLFNKLAGTTFPQRYWSGKLTSIISFLITFHYVAILWVLFRSENFQTASDSLNRVVLDFKLSDFAGFYYSRKELIYVLLFGFIWVFTSHIFKPKIQDIFIKSGLLIQILLFAITLQIILQFKDQDIEPFIYFQF